MYIYIYIYGISKGIPPIGYEIKDRGNHTKFVTGIIAYSVVAFTPRPLTLASTPRPLTLAYAVFEYGQHQYTYIYIYI